MTRTFNLPSLCFSTIIIRNLKKIRTKIAEPHMEFLIMTETLLLPRVMTRVWTRVWTRVMGRVMTRVWTRVMSREMSRVMSRVMSRAPLPRTPGICAFPPLS